ncbi:MAG: endonuclease/exonuclease/phosphatase family protein [Planctomycetota bacterium]
MVEIVEEAEPGALREAPLPSRSVLVRGLLVVVLVGALTPSVLGLLGRFGWLLDLCNHFRFQCVLVLLITTLGLVLMRCWRWSAVSLAGLVLNLAFVLPLYLGSPGIADPSRPTFTAMHFNVNTSNKNHEGVVGEVLQHQPDLLFVQEVNRRWLDELEGGLLGYELIAEDARSDNFGIACFVRSGIDTGRTIQIEAARAFDLTGGVAQVPVIEVVFEWGGQTVSVLSIHPLPPVSLAYARARDASLKAAGEWSEAQETPRFIIGDFNATPWSTAFRDLQSAGGLINSQAGFGRAPTWPAGLGSLGMIPIDHLLHSRDFVTVRRLIGQAHGSDHKPLVVELGWRD